MTIHRPEPLLRYWIGAAVCFGLFALFVVLLAWVLR
jgi:hypothetical protein